MSIKSELKSLNIRGWNILYPMAVIHGELSFITLTLNNGEQLNYSIGLTDMDDLNLEPVLDFSKGIEDRVNELKKLLSILQDDEIFWLLRNIGEVIFAKLKGQDFYLNYNCHLYESDIKRIFDDKTFVGVNYQLGNAIANPFNIKYIVTFAVRSTLDSNDVEKTKYLIYSTMNAAHKHRLFDYLFSQVNPQLGFHWVSDTVHAGYVNEAMHCRLQVDLVHFLGLEENVHKVDKIVSYEHGLLNPKIEVKPNHFL